MKKILTILAIVIAVVIFGAFAVDWPDPSIKVDGMKVQGPEEFRQDIVEGLDLLREKAPEHYAMVVGNIRKVYLSEDDFNGWILNTGFSFSQEAYSNYGEYEPFLRYNMALTLAHEGQHAQRWNSGEWTSDTPTEEWYAVETEKEVANLIDAPQDIKDWLDTVYETRWWEEE